MTSLLAPLTIIGGSDDKPFHPPAATWFDEDLLHFVALEARPHSSYDGRSENGSEFEDGGRRDGEIVHYRAYGIPKPVPINNDDSTSDTSNQFTETALDSAKNAAQGNLRALTMEISVRLTLPLELATIETALMDGSVLTEDDELTYATESTTVVVSRRIPTLARFSPKMSNGQIFLAMVFGDIVRIAMVEEQRDGELPKKSMRGSCLMSEIREGYEKNVQWTIDLSIDPTPVASKPERIPNVKQSSRTGIFGAASKHDNGFVPGTTSIIGGGVLWLARGHMQQGENTFLDLIVVTQTSTLVYNMDMVKMHLVKTQIFPHDLAVSFWYEPIARCLMIGSYKRILSPNSGIIDGGQGYDESFIVEDEEIKQRSSSFPLLIMSMRTLYFSKVSPSVDTFPPFSVGTMREVAASEKDKQHDLLLSYGQSVRVRQEHNSEGDAVLPSEISLLNMYGSVYCVELGSMGSGYGSIGLTRLDREAGCINVRHQKFDVLRGHRASIESISVGVIDNLLCVFTKSEETTIFLDVSALFSDDQRVFCKGIERFEPTANGSAMNVHSKTLSFVPPSYFLDTNGQGHLYGVALSLSPLLQNVPTTECIIPFLLRRRMPRTIILTHIMERFLKLIYLKDLSSLRNWIMVVVEQYSECEVARQFDFESSAHLLPKSSLLSPDDNVDTGDMAGQMMMPVLTQTDVLEFVLLPHAMSATKKGDQNEVKFISSLATFYFIELEKRSATACVALQCLVVALLWRTGEYRELKAFLSARETQWIITRRRCQLNLSTENRMFFDSPGSAAYAETLFLIARNGCSDDSLHHQAVSTARLLISHATIILLGCGATSRAVKCLLSVGHLNYAMNISKKIKPSKGDENVKLAEGIQSKDFFRAAISNARKMTSITDRCKSFFHLHCFLQQWDPSVFTLVSREVEIPRLGRPTNKTNKKPLLTTWVVEQSILAHEFPFPDDLFGGDSQSLRKLRSMFGYDE